MADVVYRYDEKKNPTGDYIPGVPLRDLTAEDVAALSEHLAGGVADCAFYVPVAVRAARAALPTPKETKEAGHAETK